MFVINHIISYPNAGLSLKFILWPPAVDVLTISSQVFGFFFSSPSPSWSVETRGGLFVVEQLHEFNQL